MMDKVSKWEEILTEKVQYKEIGWLRKVHRMSKIKLSKLKGQEEKMMGQEQVGMKG